MLFFNGFHFDMRFSLIYLMTLLLLVLFLSPTQLQNNFIIDWYIKMCTAPPTLKTYFNELWYVLYCPLLLFFENIKRKAFFEPPSVYKSITCSFLIRWLRLYRLYSINARLYTLSQVLGSCGFICFYVGPDSTLSIRWKHKDH